MNWDPSVKSIAAFPAIVTMLDKNLDWTNSLGVAFTHQQSDVMAQIQFLRHQAQNAGNLASNDKIVCRDDGPNIVIVPAEPNVVFAPHYNPAVVYGSWPWAEYPPVYFSPAYFGVGALGVGVGWAWGPAWPIVPAFWGWYGVNWGMRSIAVDGGGYSRIAFGNAAWGGGNWQHPGGVSHGGFGGGMRAGSSSQQGASRASGGQQGGGGGYQAAHGGGHQGGGRYQAAHAGGNQGGGGHASGGHGGGGHQGGGGHGGGGQGGGGHGGGGHGGGGQGGGGHASGGHGGGHGG